MEKLKGSGAIARGLASGALGVVTVSFVANVLLGNNSGWPIALVFQLVFILIFVRALFVGIYVDDSRIRLVSWTYTRELAWQRLRRTDAVPYHGLLSKGIDTTLASIVQVTLDDGRQIVVFSTIGRPRTVIRQARELNRLIRRGK